MIDFDYVKARDVSDALSRIAQDPAAKFVAGGTNLIDLMKENVARPTRLIDITGLPLSEIEETDTFEKRMDGDDTLARCSLQVLVFAANYRGRSYDNTRDAFDVSNVGRVQLTDFIQAQSRERPNQRDKVSRPFWYHRARLRIARSVILAPRVEGGREDRFKLII